MLDCGRDPEDAGRQTSDPAPVRVTRRKAKVTMRTEFIVTSRISLPVAARAQRQLLVQMFGTTAPRSVLDSISLQLLIVTKPVKWRIVPTFPKKWFPGMGVPGLDLLVRLLRD